MENLNYYVLFVFAPLLVLVVMLVGAFFVLPVVLGGSFALGLADTWVDCALRLEDRDMRMMSRVVRAQMERMEASSAAAAAAPVPVPAPGVAMAAG